MEFLLLTCWSCDRQFYTASERSSHHLEAHERLTRRDGTPLVGQRLEPQGGASNGVRAWPLSLQSAQGGA